MRKTVLFIAIFLFFNSIESVFSSGSDEKTLKIYYTSSLNGNLDGCKCKSNPRAGLVKRAYFLKREELNNAVLIDTGDIFDVDKDPLLSDYILESYRDLNYSVIAVGDQELSNGSSYLLDRIDSSSFLSNNMSIKSRNGTFRKISSSPLFITKNGISAVVISIISPSVFRYYPEEVNDEIAITPVMETLESLLELDRVKKADLRILIFHGPVEEAENAGEENPLIDIIISGHDQQLIDAVKAGNAVLVSPGREGNTTGILEISLINGKLYLNNSFKTFNFETDPDDNATRVRINNYISEMTGRVQKSR